MDFGVPMRENSTLEFKETITNTFLKTVSAFANYGGGTILFGVDDNGNAVGLKDPIQACLDIENKINDSIHPQPRYSLNVNSDDSTVVLKVSSGESKPYLYKSKAYRRSDSATVEVDTLEMSRLVLQGKNLSFDRLPANMQSLTFCKLESEIKQKVGVKTFDEDTLRTLGLYSTESGYNNAAALLADSNEFPGIDMALFGESISIIRRRETSQKKSVLIEYEDALKLFRESFRYEQVSGAIRKTVYRIPEEAFREAIANAIAHRAWDVNAQIRVAMFENRIEVTSPGGLPAGLSEREYLEDMISVRRNPVLAEVLFRLGVIEAFGTGIRRIKDTYETSMTKPQFRITQNTVTVILPVLKDELGLTRDQQQVFDLLSSAYALSMGELSAHVEFGRSKLTKIVKDLIAQGVVKSEGTGRGTKYRRV